METLHAETGEAGGVKDGFVDHLPAGRVETEGVKVPFEHFGHRNTI